MKAVISGYGKMGHMVEQELLRRGIEVAGASEDISSFDPEIAKECVCIDFTVPQAIRANYPVLARNFKAVVIGTTGWDDIKDDVISCFKENNTTMIYASNFSVGVNMFFAMAEKLSALMAKTGGYMPYVEEKHHCHKLDKPSGTAKTIIGIVKEATGQDPDVAAIRAGEIPGIHTLGFEGVNDRIVMTHEAFSRAGFASGAVDAAVLADSMEGVFDFKDIIFKD